MTNAAIRAALFDAADYAESLGYPPGPAIWAATDGVPDAGLVAYGVRHAMMRVADGAPIWAMGTEHFAATARLAAVVGS